MIEYPARPGWKLTDDEKPAESYASFHRFPDKPKHRKDNKYKEVSVKIRVNPRPILRCLLCVPLSLRYRAQR